MSASAYVDVFTHFAPTGYATSTFGASEWVSWGNTTTWADVVIDCEKLGISEVASTTFTMYTSTGASSPTVWVTDRMSGRVSDNSLVITGTARDRSWSFTPPIWCEGTQVMLTRATYVTVPVLLSVGGNSTEVQSKSGVYVIGNGASASLGAYQWKIPVMWVVGSFSTSTGGGGNSTTTYNFYTATTSPTEAIEQMTTVHLAFALLIVLFLTAIITYTFTYGRSRPT